MDKKIEITLLEDEESIISLTNDDGEEVDFFEIATAAVGDDQYVILQPAEPMEDIEEDEVVILKFEENEEFLDLVMIEDEELAEKIFTEYQRAYADYEAQLSQK